MKFLRLIILSSLLFLTSCTIVNIPASNAFYINDMAGALLSSTEYYIYTHSKELYDNDSQKNDFKARNVNGTQVVVATHMGPLGSLDSTQIFNEWGIGDNDMGLFLLLYFEENPDDKYMPTYLGMTREIGAKMAGFISMFKLEEIFIDTWENPPYAPLHANDYDYKLVYFYTAILEEIYTKVYDYTTFPFTTMIEDYEIVQYDSFYNYLPKGSTPRIKLTWWAYLIIILGGLMLFGSGGMLYIFLGPGSSSSGGGGKSHGYHYTR